MRQILAIIAIVALVMLIRLWFNQPKSTRIRWILYAVATIVVVLAVTGKLHWLMALGATVIGALPIIIKKLYFLLRYFPLIGGLISRAGYGKSGNARFETTWLRLEVNPALGTLDGEVLQGEFKNRRLSSMSLAELEKLKKILRGQDLKSTMLLQSYITVRNRTRGTHSESTETHTDTSMTRDEALNILGLKANATREDITRAYKRLIQKIHPDRGGSSYLTIKINQAKELLLKKDEDS